MTLIKLVKSTTSDKVTHLYEIKVHGSDGLIRTRNMKINESDSTYGKLRMSGNRFAYRSNNYGPFTLIEEEVYAAHMSNWKRA
jgi:hypothetical protein